MGDMKLDLQDGKRKPQDEAKPQKVKRPRTSNSSASKAKLLGKSS